jgi:hypothetical protein
MSADMYDGKSMSFAVTTTLVQIPALLFTGHVNLDKRLKISDPQL